MMSVFDLKGVEAKNQALLILRDLETKLNYQFRNPEILLAAVTHPSGRAHFQLEADYEKLEAVGDAILDYLIGINMMRNTMFERYRPQLGESGLTDE